MGRRARSQANLESSSPYRASRRSVARREGLAGPGLAMLGLVAAAAVITGHIPSDLALLKQPQRTTSEAFRIAVNKAMAAAELTQSAKFREEWHAVATLWQEAIDMMQAVPAENQRYALAQNKVGEYQRNLNYAQDNTVTRPAKETTASVWSKNSVREVVTAIEGEPSRIVQLDTQCKEILYYGDSQVELLHGIVSKYSDVDDNLQASALDVVVAQQLAEEDFWTLGSAKEAVYAIQGTPGRVNRYDSLDMEVLYYGDDFVELRGDRVVAYSNFDRTLSVSVAPVLNAAEASATQGWSVGSHRQEVFQAQRTPTQIQRRASLCEEVLHYGRSTVDLRNGVVVGYNNSAANLLVR